MPAEYLIVNRRVKKQLLKLPLPIHQKIIKGLKLIKLNPLFGIKLHGELQQCYKLRIGDYRVVYTFDSKESVLEVLQIEHRQGVYK